jgi:uncharacterized protein
MPRVRIVWNDGEVIANLRSTRSAKQLVAALPHQATAWTWGEEVYFGLPVKTALEADSRQIVEPGTVCYWVEGNALALPFGPTPASRDKECRLVTRCNVLGQIEGDPRQLAKVRPGNAIRVELIPDKADS